MYPFVFSINLIFVFGKRVHFIEIQGKIKTESSNDQIKKSNTADK